MSVYNSKKEDCLYFIYVIMLFLVCCSCGEECQNNLNNMPQDVRDALMCSGYYNYIENNVDTINFFEYDYAPEQCVVLNGTIKNGCTTIHKKCHDVYIRTKDKNGVITLNYITGTIIHETYHLENQSDDEERAENKRREFERVFEGECKNKIKSNRL